MQRTRRGRAFVLAAAVCLFLLFSVGFLAAEANHTHPDDTPCPICARMETQIQLFQTLTAAGAGIAGLGFLRLFRRKPETLRPLRGIAKPTPVNLRVLLLR